MVPHNFNANYNVGGNNFRGGGFGRGRGRGRGKARKEKIPGAVGKRKKPAKKKKTVAKKAKTVAAKAGATKFVMAANKSGKERSFPSSTSVKVKTEKKTGSVKDNWSSRSNGHFG